jgi:GYF domain 2
MAVEWFLQDLSGQVGPLGTAELRKKLSAYPDFENLLIWREGFQDWKPVAEVVDFTGASGPTLGAPPTETPQELISVKPTPRRSNNFIAKNWRGEYPLPVSYWLFGLIGNFAIALVPLGLSALYELKSGFQPGYVFAFVLSVWLITTAISIWQWVSVWRSANRYRRQKALRLKRAPWAGVAKLLAVLAFLQLANAVVRTGIPQIVEASRVAFMDDPDIPDYSIRVMRNGTAAEITGGIKYGLADDFQKILRASSQIRVVHLDSIGGRIGEAEKLYRLIKDAGLATYVPAKCLSACTLAFSGGRDRVLRHGATLGFHRGSFAGKDEQDSPELQGQRKIFTEAGYDAPFIDRALATPSANMWAPTEAVLLQSRVITAVSDGSDYALSGLPANTSVESLSTSIAESGGIYAAIKARFPKDYDEMVRAYYEAFVAGKTEAEVGALLQDRLANLISANRHLADDDVIVDLGNLIADQLTALQKQGTATCYKYAAEGVVDDGLMPEALAKREADIEQRIVLTATRTRDTGASGEALRQKLFRRLAAKGITKDDLALIGSKAANSQQSRFCSVMTALYREAAAMPQQEAAIALRSLVAER